MELSRRLKFAAGGLAAVAVVLSGCGEDTSRTVDVPTGERAAVTKSFETWAGTIEDHQAAEVVVEYRQNGAYSECMVDQGFDLPWQAWVNTVAPLDPLATDVWLSDPSGPYFVDQLQAQAATVRADTANEDAELSEKERIAGDECLEEAGPGPSDDELQRVRDPEVVRALGDAWSRSLQKYTAEFGTIEDFLGCMSEKDLPGKPRGSEDLDAFVRALHASAPPFSAVPAPGTRSEAADWLAYVGRAQAFADASWDCRRATYDKAFPGLASVVTAFEKNHAADIAEAQAHWSAVRAEAAGLTS